MVARLTVVRDSTQSVSHNGGDILRLAVCSEPLARLTLDSLVGDGFPDRRSAAVAVPRHWAVQTTSANCNLFHYHDCLPIPNQAMNPRNRGAWLVIADAQFAVLADHKLLYRILDRLQSDVVAVNVLGKLRASYEKVLTDSNGRLIGFRMLYEDMVQPAPLGDDWPNYLFIKCEGLTHLLTDNALPVAFSDLVDICSSKPIELRSVSIGATVLNLATERGLLTWLADKLTGSPLAKNNAQTEQNNVQIADGARLFGKVLLGRNVRIGRDAVIVGPTVLCDGATVEDSAAVKSCVLGADVSLPAGCVIQNRVLNASPHSAAQTHAENMPQSSIDACISAMLYGDSFRSWPSFSYARCFKRIADVIAAIIVLVLFLPIFPIIAIAIKLASRGPVFFKDPRQGLHASHFECIKFRTMKVGAHKIQNTLRILNQADGPQFKLTDDPRINPVGRFLRDTYLDEIPQFFNVLLGQMSVVGPRPSPEAENTLCPSWRDARLSVRPGLTGLWQVRRTRQPMKDFQEWIHYDVDYVRTLSLKLDIWICWRTARKMFRKFIERF